jgi:hypothetical protein
MENPFYRIDEKNTCDPYETMVEAYATQLGEKTTREILQKEVSHVITEKMTQDWNARYKTALESIIEDTKRYKEIETAHENLKKKYTETKDLNQKRECVEAAKKIKQQFDRIEKERKLSEEIVRQHRSVCVVGSRSRENVGSRQNIGSHQEIPIALAWRLLEKVLNIKCIFLSEEAFKNKDYSHILVTEELIEGEGEAKSQGEPLYPEFYVIVEITSAKSEFRTVSYQDKKLLTYHEIPYDLKKMIEEKCAERNGGLFHRIPHFETKAEASTDERRFDELSETKLMNLYDEDVVFVFYEKSTQKLPGRGAGEKMVPHERIREFAELANIPDWRKKLSNSWIQPFSIDNQRWSSVEHYCQAVPFKKNHPDFYLGFALGSGTDISKQVAVAVAAGEGKTGKYKGELLRPSGVVADYVDKKKVMYEAQLAKFQQNEDLNHLLRGTKKAKLMHFVRGKEPELYESLIMVRETLFRKSG